VSGQAWRPKAYTTAAGPSIAAAEAEAAVTPEKEAPGLAKMFKGPLGADFNVDNNTFAQAQIRATFYPKFENEKSDQEVCFSELGLLLVMINYLSFLMLVV